MLNIFDSGSYQKSLDFNNILRITLDFAKQRNHKHLIQTLIGFLTQYNNNNLACKLSKGFIRNKHSLKDKIRAFKLKEPQSFQLIPKFFF